MEEQQLPTTNNPSTINRQSVRTTPGSTAKSTIDAKRQAARDELNQFRESIQRYRHHIEQLPYHITATCPQCLEQVPAYFGWSNETKEQLLLTFDCPNCSVIQEHHHDTIWSTPRPDRQGSATVTNSGHTIKTNARTLPRTVATLCPECCGVVVGRYFIENSAVIIEKSCPEHGYYRDIINRDAKLFLKAAKWSYQEQPGPTNPNTKSNLGCPSDCGLCAKHQSISCLANIDLTNRCNLNCPICFANANVQGYIYEPSLEEIEVMLQALRDLRPTPATAVQFSGGEPTVHPQFFDIVAAARRKGFSNIQIATNGLKMADYDFAEKARDAGLHTLYMQFDGIRPEVYIITRGRNVFDEKLQAIENCRKLDMKVCLVPTIIRTVNDDQVGPIFNFAVDNIDVVNAISYQPVCFTGRIDQKQRLEQRYTLGDLARDLAHASGAVVHRDFYPLSIVMPLAQLLETVTGDPKIKPSCHTECAIGTYFLVSPDRRVFPFPKVIDVEALFTGMNEFARKLAPRAGKLNIIDKYRLLQMFKATFRSDQAPPEFSAKKFMRTLEGMLDKSKGRGKRGSQNYRTLMAAGMHFQDRYNYDIERTKRCVIPYSTPEGIIPFCAYNSGPSYRNYIEKIHMKEKGI